MAKTASINTGNSRGTDAFGMPIVPVPTVSLKPQITTTKSSTQNNISSSVSNPGVTQSSTKVTVTDVTPKAETISEIDIIKNDLKALKGAFYKNNTPSNQDFVKSSRFTTRLKLPLYAVAPTTCAIGEVYVNSGSGKLYVCSASNTWSLVGTQV